MQERLITDDLVCQIFFWYSLVRKQQLELSSWDSLLAHSRPKGMVSPLTGTVKHNVFNRWEEDLLPVPWVIGRHWEMELFEIHQHGKRCSYPAGRQHCACCDGALQLCSAQQREDSATAPTHLGAFSCLRSVIPSEGKSCQLEKVEGKSRTARAGSAALTGLGVDPSLR